MITKEQAARWGEYPDAERLFMISTSSKPFALIIDHVGNVIRHGLPDAPRMDTLDRRNSRATSAVKAAASAGSGWFDVAEGAAGMMEDRGPVDSRGPAGSNRPGAALIDAGSIAAVAAAVRGAAHAWA